MLQLKYRHSDEEVKAFGHSETLAAAERERDALIERAVATLAPLEITRKELLEMIERSLKGTV